MGFGQAQPGAAPARPGRFPLHPGLFFLTAALAVLGLISTYLYFVRTTTGQYIDDIDESALVEVAAAKRGVGEQTSHFLDALPVTSVVIGALLVLLITIWRKRWLAAAIALIAMGGANLSTQLLKASLPDRPDRGVPTLDLNSLPSGHSTLAASSAVAVFLVASPRWRPFVAFAGGSYAVVSGTSTLINQWHRPADVLAAYLMVGAWSALAGWAILRWGKDWNSWQGFGQYWVSSRIWPLLSVLIGIGAAAVAVFSLQALAAPKAISSNNYFLAGAAMIVISGYLISVAGVLLFGWEPRRRSAKR
ncbi:PAP2 superfamily protein [Renibacterium salmoninarum ATCC 33209]|uniref:PAP2 superfamily protein n=1 Tax=Renibacterium salmoninarum (strain ATCC 33209 / DSM 20767 / JCM 11484 / NBRC 15589 / NCIMB 2235) TaxID=288705 RepID=A9WRT9_RENSM|nr:phosphatase PAP2 family protein [Renibacterium salmoninarum]ABY24370.1 PAP2 superfamily protein [Renibacterium salmoninarum ATCC 33209]